MLGANAELLVITEESGDALSIQENGFIIEDEGGLFCGFFSNGLRGFFGGSFGGSVFSGKALVRGDFGQPLFASSFIGDTPQFGGGGFLGGNPRVDFSADNLRAEGEALGIEVRRENPHGGFIELRDGQFPTQVEIFPVGFVMLEPVEAGEVPMADVIGDEDDEFHGGIEERGGSGRGR